MNTQKYIYLDWNVMKYVKKPRVDYKDLDLEFKEIVSKIGTKYYFPYSEGHMRDLFFKYDEKNRNFISSDLNFLSSLSNDIAINPEFKDDFLVNKDPNVFFEEILIDELKAKPNIEIPIEVENIDVAKLEEEHPFYELLVGRQNLDSIDSYEQFIKLYNNHDLYKKYRIYIPEIKKAIQNNIRIEELDSIPIIVFCIPFLELCEKKYDEEQLLKKYEEVVRSWLLYKYKNPEKVPFGDVISTGYSLLDFHPLFNEKVNKKNTLSNITRDSKHAFFAHKAEYFVSEDKSTIKKMKFLYKALNVKTKVVKMSEFVNKFS